MLSRLIAFSLRNAALVLAAAAAVLGVALYQVRDMPVDVFPELNAPTVVVLTEAGGLAADEVEQYVTFPIETSLNGLPGVRRVRSGSAGGLSIIYAESTGAPTCSGPATSCPSGWRSPRSGCRTGRTRRSPPSPA